MDSFRTAVVPARSAKKQTPQQTAIPGNQSDPMNEQLTLQAIMTVLKAERPTQKDEETSMGNTELMPAIFDLKFIEAAIEDDKELRQVRKALQATHEGEREKAKEKCGWKYKQYWDDMHTQENVVFFQHKLIIPEQLVQAVLRRLHIYHCGARTMNARAEYLWFLQLNRQIEAAARACKACTKTGKKFEIINT